MTTVGFDVEGNPAPAGSTRAFVVHDRITGKPKAVTTAVKNKDSDTWRETVIVASRRAMGYDGAPRPSQRWELEGPVDLVISFRVRRPRSVPIAKRALPTVKPDLDKYVRSTMDAMTMAGVWGDDCQVVSIRATKVYADGTDAGATVVATDNR